MDKSKDKDTAAKDQRAADDRAVAKAVAEADAADREHETQDEEAAEAEHLAAAKRLLGEVERDATAEKASIDEHAAGARADIDNAAADARAAVDAKVEEAKPEEEKVSPEQRHHQYCVELRDIRDRALQASRHVDIRGVGQAAHDVADLLHRMLLDERLPPVPLASDPMESELVGHHRAPVRTSR